MKRARIASLEAAVHSSGALAVVEKYPPRGRKREPIRAEYAEPIPGEAVAAALDLMHPSPEKEQP